MVPFGEEHAAVYDAQFGNMSPIRDSLDLITTLALHVQPEDASVLCAGAGTGTEVLALAAAHPGWRFCLAEPAPAMLAVARRKLGAAGLLERCTFHEGYLDSLPPGERFDGATSLLVSHFLTETNEREAYFREIAVRLRPGGTLVDADLAADRSDPRFDRLMEVWLTGIQTSNATSDMKDNYRADFGTAFAAHSPSEVEALIQGAGFEAPVQIFQGMLIRGWVTSRT